MPCSVCPSPTGFVYDTKLFYCPNCGITRAIDPTTTIAYDQEYVAQRYDRYETTKRMSHLRAAHLEQILHLHEVLSREPPYVLKGRLLDVGYGNGSFIRVCNELHWDAFGLDVNPTEYEGVRPITLQEAITGPRWRVVTFFDSLEHFEDLSVIRKIVQNTDWIMVSAPLPPKAFPKWVEGWKHYRPGEHHSYFSAAWSYEKLFQTKTHEALVRYVGTPEDIIRGKLSDGSDNIMTVALSCREKVSCRK